MGSYPTEIYDDPRDYLRHGAGGDTAAMNIRRTTPEEVPVGHFEDIRQVVAEVVPGERYLGLVRQVCVELGERSKCPSSTTASMAVSMPRFSIRSARSAPWRSTVSPAWVELPPPLAHFQRVTRTAKGRVEHDDEVRAHSLIPEAHPDANFIYS